MSETIHGTDAIKDLQKFLNTLTCSHTYIDIQSRMPKPFNSLGFPKYDGDDWWIYDEHIFECAKCGRKIMRKVG